MADTSSTLNPARTWIFQANPKFFNIDAALAEMREMSWSVNQYKQSISPGDAVFIWRSGPEAGIVAAATVLTAPAIMEQDALQFAVQTDRFDKPALRARLQIDEVYPITLSRDVLKSRLPDLSILQSPQGTNFPVTPEEAALIREMLQPAETDADEILPDSSTAGRGRASRIWAYAPGPNAQFWEEFYRDGIMAIGWDELGDLSQYPDQPAIAQKLIEAYKSENRPLNATRACFDFVHSIKPGDQVIVKRGRAEVVGYGIITGGYCSASAGNGESVPPLR